MESKNIQKKISFRDKISQINDIQEISKKEETVGPKKPEKNYREEIKTILKNIFNIDNLKENDLEFFDDQFVIDFSYEGFSFSTVTIPAVEYQKILQRNNDSEQDIFDIISHDENIPKFKYTATIIAEMENITLTLDTEGYLTETEEEKYLKLYEKFIVSLISELLKKIIENAGKTEDSKNPENILNNNSESTRVNDVS